MRAYLAFAVVLLAAPAASADAIRIPQCPDGWQGRRVGHGGYCFPVACGSDADCVGGRVCRPIGRCFRRQMRSAGRRPLDPDDPSSYFHRPDPDSECTDSCPGRSQECRVANECLPPESGAPPGEPPPDDAPPAEPAPTDDDPPAEESDEGDEPTEDPAPAASTPEHTSSGDGPEDDSSGCAAGRGGAPLAWLAALSFVGVLRRRRR